MQWQEAGCSGRRAQDVWFARGFGVQVSQDCHVSMEAVSSPGEQHRGSHHCYVPRKRVPGIQP